MTLSRRNFLASAAAAPVLGLASRLSMLTPAAGGIIVPAALRSIVSSATAFRIAGGAALTVIQLKPAQAVVPFLTMKALAVLAAAWGMGRLSAQLDQDHGEPYEPTAYDSFHDLNGPTAMVSEQRRLISEQGAGGAVMRVQHDGRVALDSHYTGQNNYHDISEGEALILGSVGHGLVPWTERTPPTQKSRALWEQVKEETKARGQRPEDRLEYSRIFSNPASKKESVLLASKTGATGRTLVIHA